MTAGEQQPGPQRSASPPERLTKRASFLRAAKGVRYFSPSMSVQFAAMARAADDAPRFGFTVTKRTGNSVERNRIRRRLREAVRLAPALEAQGGGDYVIVAKREALATPFAALTEELQKGVRKANARAAKNLPANSPAKFPRKGQERTGS